jgi:hypothetical protein
MQSASHFPLCRRDLFSIMIYMTIKQFSPAAGVAHCRQTHTKNASRSVARLVAYKTSARFTHAALHSNADAAALRFNFLFVVVVVVCQDARVRVGLRGGPRAADGGDGGRRHPRARRLPHQQEVQQHAAGRQKDAAPQGQRGRVPGGAVGAGHLPAAAARRPPPHRPQAALALPAAAQAGHQQPHQAVQM